MAKVILLIHVRRFEFSLAHRKDYSYFRFYQTDNVYVNVVRLLVRYVLHVEESVSV
jgi:hypothetical protein